MPSTALTPVFVGLRTGLHVLLVALLALVVARAFVDDGQWSLAIVAGAALFGATYAVASIRAPARVAALRTSPAARRLWLAALTAEWMLLLCLSKEAAYLVFPLFFVFLHVLGRRGGILAVAAATVATVVGLGVHDGWSVAGAIGPCIGAGVAVLIGLGYSALAREALEREHLVRELLDTQASLAASEREAGTLAERARLAREIHDTVAQGLSSIQLLLHAAEQADPEGPGVGHVRLARVTAAENLAETRRFIRALAPPELDGAGLEHALRRLAASTTAAHGLDVRVNVRCETLPMPVQTALLRIAQGAVANVVQHAHATRAEITLEATPNGLLLTVSDDGVGFDGAAAPRPERADGESFGLTAARERVEQLGGTLHLTSGPRGSSIAVTLPREAVT